MGALKNHQRACPAKLVADAASATKEKKRSARHSYTYYGHTRYGCALLGPVKQGEEPPRHAAP